MRNKLRDEIFCSAKYRFLVLAVTLCFWFEIAHSNPYIAKPGEAPLRLRIATCSVTGGFVHLYTALENNLFDKYGFKLEHIYIRGTGPSLAALMADEIQFLYCAAEATIPALASGIEAKIVAAPLVKMPFVLVTQKEIRRLEDLRGKSLGIVRPGDLSDRLSRQLVKRFNVADVTMRPDRRQSIGTLPSDGSELGSRRRDHAAPRRAREERRLQCCLSFDRHGFAVYL